MNYKRELVTLFVPFHNEVLDVLDRNKFLMIFEERKEEIMKSKREFDSDFDMEKFLDDIQNMAQIYADQEQTE